MYPLAKSGTLNLKARLHANVDLAGHYHRLMIDTSGCPVPSFEHGIGWDVGNQIVNANFYVFVLWIYTPPFIIQASPQGSLQKCKTTTKFQFIKLTAGTSPHSIKVSQKTSIKTNWTEWH